jgi:hypothetical protein
MCGDVEGFNYCSLNQRIHKVVLDLQQCTVGQNHSKAGQKSYFTGIV